MEYYNYYWFLFLVSLRGLESANIYVIDLPIDEQTNSQDYDDYGITYDDNFRQEKLKQHVENSNSVFCHRLFGSIYKNKDQHIRCLNALKLGQKSRNVGDKWKNTMIATKPRFKGPVGRDKDVKKKFSQDYLDVGDLARSDIASNFASDYLDIDDFRGIRSIVPGCKDEIDEFGQITKTHCVPASRKATSLENLDNFQFKVEGSSEMDEAVSRFLRKGKHKRFSVISKENKYRDTSDSDKSDDDQASSSESDSIEVTTRKPKRNKKIKREIEPYNYIQGNKWYEQDDFRKKLNYYRNWIENNNEDNRRYRFRRGLRMSTFLPKRFHWDESDYQNLGYYWFNGPRGKYLET